MIDRVGGQLVSVFGMWAQRVTNFLKDHTQMGLLTGTPLQAHQHKILILSTYWPIKPVEQNNNSQQWNKVLRYLRELGDHSTPIDFIKHTIQERLWSHINGSPNNVATLMGDINSTWGTTATEDHKPQLFVTPFTLSLFNCLQIFALTGCKTC